MNNVFSEIFMRHGFVDVAARCTVCGRVWGDGDMTDMIVHGGIIECGDCHGEVKQEVSHD